MSGQNPADPTWTTDQSETAINVSNLPASSSQIITVTYNDGTDPNHLIQYTPTTRTVFFGASNLGWSFSTDGGKSFTYGGKVKADSIGQGLLWGDPAIASWPGDSHFVFLSNLSATSDKLGPGQSVFDTISNSTNGVQSVLDGACVVRSTDGGKTFATQVGDIACVTNGEQFYDGTSLTVTPAGQVWFATRNVTAGPADVWMAPAANATTLAFTQMPNPFPGKLIADHPMLRTGVNGLVYILGEDSTASLWISRWNGAWSTPVMVDQAILGPALSLQARTVRSAQNYAFDTARSTYPLTGQACTSDAACLPFGRCDMVKASCQPADQLRVVYVKPSAGDASIHIAAASCDLDLVYGCSQISGWGTIGNSVADGEEIEPVLRVYPGTEATSPVWQAGWLHSNPGTVTVNVVRAQIIETTSGGSMFSPTILVANKTVCPDHRGYWGDYNDIQVSGVNAGVVSFITAFTNSDTPGQQPCVSLDLVSHPVHVGAITFH